MLIYVGLFFCFQESFVNHPEKLRLNFIDEASNLQEGWTLSMATRDAVDQLVNI